MSSAVHEVSLPPAGSWPERAARHPDELLLDRALDLARFLHPSPALAADVVRRALLKLPIAATRQKKRRYYACTRETKLRLGHAHLLQQLVIAESVALEPRLGASGDDLLLAFIGHLVSSSLRRNLLHLTLAVTRFLYGFDTRQTAEAYGQLAPEEALMPDESYYRSRKRLLLEEIAVRFVPLVRFEKGLRGELCVAARAASAAEKLLIEAALERFAPWDVSCDGDHALQPVHTLLHPPCLRRALLCADPLDRARVPLFAEEMR